MKVRVIHQSNLTSECWSVQIWGPDYCETCQYLNSTDCGGQRIRQSGFNEKQKKVPIQ